MGTLEKYFDKLMIRGVPMGSVLNKDTANSFPLIDSYTYISKDRLFMIEAYYCGTWIIKPTTNDFRNKLIIKYMEMPEVEYIRKDLEELAVFYEENFVN